MYIKHHSNQYSEVIYCNGCNCNSHLSFSAIYTTLSHPQPSLNLKLLPIPLPPDRNQALAKKLSHQMSTINNFIYISVSHPKSRAAFDKLRGKWTANKGEDHGVVISPPPLRFTSANCCKMTLRCCPLPDLSSQ